jgi:hypothetical protein
MVPGREPFGKKAFAAADTMKDVRMEGSLRQGDQQYFIGDTVHFLQRGEHRRSHGGQPAGS